MAETPRNWPFPKYTPTPPVAAGRGVQELVRLERQRRLREVREQSARRRQEAGEALL